MYSVEPPFPTQIFGLPIGATFGLPNVSNGIHHGYWVSFVFANESVSLACLFSMKDCTPSLLSLSYDMSRYPSSRKRDIGPLRSEELNEKWGDASGLPYNSKTILESNKCYPSGLPASLHIISFIRYVLTALVFRTTSAAISSALGSTCPGSSSVSAKRPLQTASSARYVDPVVTARMARL